MSLEFIDNPDLRIGHSGRIKRFVAELMQSPDRWAKAYETPKCRKADTDYASKLCWLRRAYPQVEWQKAVDGEMLLIVGRFRRGVS